MPTRTRTTGSVSLVTASEVNYHTDGSITTVPSINGSRVGEYAEISDTVTPGYARLKSKGVIINNPMTMRKFTYTATRDQSELKFHSIPPGFVGNWRQTCDDRLGLATGPYLPPIPTGVANLHILKDWVPLLDESTMQSKAAMLALNDANGKAAQGLVMLAQAQKTLDTLRNPFAAVRELMRKAPKALKRGKLTAAVARGASAQYLTWFYGIRTVMFDIEDTLDALLLEQYTRATARGTVRDEITTSSTTVGWNYSNHRADYTSTYKEETTVRAGALLELRARTTQEALGLSVRKIPEAAWELLPWSFVVDWFLNVQQLIGALESAVSNNFLAEWMVVRHKLTWEKFTTPGTHVEKTNTPQYYVTDTCQSRQKVVVEMYDRWPLKLWQHIGFNFNYSLNKVPTLAAISLAVQQLTKKG